MTVSMLGPCLVVTDKTVQDILPPTIFETEESLNLGEKLSLALYKTAMKAELPTVKIKVGKNDTLVEFFTTYSKTEEDALLRLCDDLILTELHAAMPSRDPEDWNHGSLAPEADAKVNHIQNILDVRRMLRNFAVHRKIKKSKGQRIFLHVPQNG